MNLFFFLKENICSFLNLVRKIPHILKILLEKSFNAESYYIQILFWNAYSLDYELANVLWKGPESQYLKLWGLYDLWVTHLELLTVNSSWTHFLFPFLFILTRKTLRLWSFWHNVSPMQARKASYLSPLEKHFPKKQAQEIHFIIFNNNLVLCFKGEHTVKSFLHPFSRLNKDPEEINDAKRKRSLPERSPSLVIQSQQP